MTYKNHLHTLTYADIMALDPCYDPVERGYCGRDWRGTALDILRIEAASPDDRLWVVLREDWLPDRVLHEFALWCAEQALALIEEPDPRSLNALEIKQQWLNGNVTDAELAAAWAAAAAAAGAGAADTARAAAAAWAGAWAAQIDHLITMIEQHYE